MHSEHTHTHTHTHHKHNNNNTPTHTNIPQWNTGSNIVFSSNNSLKLGDFGMALELGGCLKQGMMETVSDFCKLSSGIFM